MDQPSQNVASVVQRLEILVTMHTTLASWIKSWVAHFSPTFQSFTGENNTYFIEHQMAIKPYITWKLKSNSKHFSNFSKISSKQQWRKQEQKAKFLLNLLNKKKKSGTQNSCLPPVQTTWCRWLQSHHQHAEEQTLPGIRDWNKADNYSEGNASSLSSIK